MVARVLTIAGSDSGGGAGIEADLKTISALGGYGCTTITGLTAQNTLGVRAVHPVPADFVVLCLRAVLEDIGVDAIKLGMLTSEAIIRAVAANLPGDVPVVLDPVMVSTSGAALLPDGAVAALISALIPKAALITPNLPEAAKITGMPVETEAQRIAAGYRLLEMGAKAALVKGGHGNEAELTDLLITPGRVVAITLPRIESRNTHGTGCTMSSAIATSLAQGLGLEAAVRRARDYLQAAIATAPGIGAGHGPVNHLVWQSGG
ncbi:MAG: bifunctional hydroxymethylpyrimidine kinase/phosphomethylpyrimidine kinase [Rhodospirillales bacterium]|nr:bifunctional hydroxymethylpyrimidine kinase/phosphomethylpyrimidine kinase [Rhodospirillales bacterium]MDE2390298.1 bifunctional hydroxymethylpyrimidine kinase/phosphomethylpyrimidine kinase [Rhodospirillales bacterium]